MDTGGQQDAAQDSHNGTIKLKTKHIREVTTNVKQQMNSNHTDRQNLTEHRGDMVGMMNTSCAGHPPLALTP